MKLCIDSARECNHRRKRRHCRGNGWRNPRRPRPYRDADTPRSRNTRPRRRQHRQHRDPRNPDRQPQGSIPKNLEG